MRGVAILPVTVHWPVDKLYSSALARKPVAFSPPATRTWPFGSNVEVCPARAMFRLAVLVQVPEAWAKAGEVVLARSTTKNVANANNGLTRRLCIFVRIM